jgi:OmcA/MtrC family decaheme c-type cytochrome
MQTAIPAGSRGTYAIGIEGRRDETVLQGTAKERTIRYGAESNKILYFSVDGSRVLPRRKVVEQAKCNACHDNLVLHGENRNTVEQCLQCHNPVETDAARRTAALMPAESVNFSNMIHRIHTGREGEGTYVIYGFGGTPIDFSHVGYPAFAPNGRVGDTRNCAMCHVNGSENLPLPATNADVRHPRGYINPAGPVTAACLGCHTSRSAASHALANTTRLGESCATCHGSTSEFSVARAHAR